MTMTIFTIMLFLLVLDIVLFLIPFFVKNFTFFEGIAGEIINYMTKRVFWVMAILLFYYNFILLMTLESIESLGIADPMIFLFHIFTFMLWVMIGWLLFMIIGGPLKIWKMYQQKLRNGEL